VVNEVEHSSMDHPTSKPWFVLTPLNALIYNSQTSNLKDHGLHPRWTHAVVNMFILFGPLTIVAYYMIVTKCVKVIYTRIASVKTDHRKSDNKYKEGNHSVVMVCMTTVLCGLGFLSLAPHQEPRFLLPLVTPLVLLGAQSQIFKSRLVVFVWISFNAVLLLLFGVLHQAGVTSSLLNINSILESIQDGNAKAVIFSRTYMPPSFLARQSKALDNISSSSDIDSMTCEASGNGDGDCPIFARKLLDLNGSTMQVLMDTLENELRCGHNNNTIDDFVLVLVPPLSEELESGDRVSFLADWGTSDNLLGKIFECNHVSYYAPHLTTEDLPPFVSDTSVVDYLHQFSLNSYRISCKANLN
jgi:phosphatidylinositol glycan class Z